MKSGLLSVMTGLCLLVCACATVSRKKADSRELETLVRYMVGDFSSQLQSQRDSDYFDIRLHIRPIWVEDKANHWLYVEQAVASAESKPYRQRIYKVEQEGPGAFKSIVYTLPEEKKWAGAYKTPEVFASLKAGDLTLRSGCTVFLKKEKNGIYSGQTQEATCESNLRGASYATSKVVITAKGMDSWDQGFNKDGKQVWGATKGAYEFLKQ